MTTCTICGGAPGRLLVRSTDRPSGQRFEVRECECCAAAFTAPRPADVAPYYEEGYYAFHSVRLTALERTRLAMIVRCAYRPIARRPAGRMLDVGCGAGRLAGAFRRLGWEVAGIEPSVSGADAARATGMEVHTGTLDDVLPWSDDSFDAVIFNHALEHVHDPTATLRRASALASPGALIGVTVPNFASWQRTLFGANWFQLDVPRHLTHFTHQSLAATAHRAGLHVVKLSSSSMLAGLVGSTMRVTGLALPPRLVRIAGLASYPLLAASDPLVGGDCLNLVARAG